MSIQVRCACGKTLAVNNKLVGRETACPDCGAILMVPVPVWAPVQLDELPELHTQPAYSSYTMPAPHAAPAWHRYRPWIFGGLALVLGGLLLGSMVVGVAWLVSEFLEPPVARQRARTATDDATANAANAPMAGLKNAGSTAERAEKRPTKVPVKTGMYQSDDRVYFDGKDYGPYRPGDTVVEIDGRIFVNGALRSRR